MFSILQRRLDEASIAERQLELEEKRLFSEADLANATNDEKQRQLEEAAANAQMAAEEFTAEQLRLDSAMNVTERALRLAEARQARQQSQPQQQPGADDGSAAVGGVDQQQQQLEQLQQFAALGLSGDEAGLAMPSTPSQKLLDNLHQMRAKLAQERTATGNEHGSMLRRMRSLTDRLNSSVMEAQSQVAAISAEASQRKRQRARLSGRQASLKALISAVVASQDVTRQACVEEQHHRGDITALITAESNVVAELLRSSGPLDAAAFTADATASVGVAPGEEDASSAAAASLLQVSSAESGLAAQRALTDLRKLASRFPEEAALFIDGTKKLGANDQDDETSGADYPAAAADTVEANARDPLSSIRQFVGSDAGAGGGSSASAPASNDVAPGNPVQAAQTAQAIRDVYTGLIGKVRSRSRDVSEEKARCDLLTRDAAVDEAALARALHMVSAKQNLAQAVMQEYSQNLEYSEAQQKAINGQLAQLEEAVRKTDQLTASGSDRLNSYAQQLLSLGSVLSQEGLDPAPVQNLVQKIEEHRSLLMRRATDLRRQATDAGAADRSLIRLLGADTQQSRRQLSRAKAESELLASRVRTKADDQELGEKFLDMVASACSSDKLQKLKSRSEELGNEQKALKSAATEAADIQGGGNSAAVSSAVEELAGLLPKPQTAS